jgi:hypothetical protein
MVFNDGNGSDSQPADNHLSRTYSEVSVYSINTGTMTAHQVWNFNYGESIFTDFCGSVYEAGQSYLVDFANEASTNNLTARLVGLDSNHNVAFDFRYSQTGLCGTWNAIPINFENLEITGDIQAALTSPTRGTVLAGPTATFNWTSPTGATSYILDLGTTQGAKDLFGSGTVTATSIPVYNLPTDGSTVYARLFTVIGSKLY